VNKDELMDKLKKVKIIITDVDGVLTDGYLYIGSNDLELKKFNVFDGAGIALLKAASIPLVFLSGRYSKATVARAEELGLLDNLYQSGHAKIEEYQKIKEKFKVSDDEIVYIGDDIIDIPVLRKVGIPIAVNNANDEVKKLAVYITRKNGGEGALREVIELLLNAKGLFEKSFEKVTHAPYRE